MVTSERLYECVVNGAEHEWNGSGIESERKVPYFGLNCYQGDNKIGIVPRCALMETSEARMDGTLWSVTG